MQRRRSVAAAIAVVWCLFAGAQGARAQQADESTENGKESATERTPERPSSSAASAAETSSSPPSRGSASKEEGSGDAAAPPESSKSSAKEPSSASGPGSEGRTAKNSVFGELLGPGLWYSVNYERMVIDDLGVRVGFMFISLSASAGSTSSSAKFVTLPMTVNYIGVSSGTHSLEVGGGGTLAHASSSTSSGGLNAAGSGVGGWGNIHVGYRIQPPDGGFQFRVGVNGYVGRGLSFDADDPDKVGFIALPYLSLGGTF